MTEKIVLPIFGELDLQNIEELYESSFKFRQKEVLIDLNFETKNVTIQTLEAVKSFLGILKQSIILGYRELVFENVKDGATYDYIQFHIENMYKSELEKVDKLVHGNIAIEDKLFSLIHIHRIGIYPSIEEGFGVFDYKLELEKINHLVVVFFNKFGKVVYTGIES